MTLASLFDQAEAESERTVEIRVRGRVQGVGFRPMVWREARALGLRGEVLNDGEGVLIRTAGAAAAIERLIERLRHHPPPLASVEAIEQSEFVGALPAEFKIVASVGGKANTQIAPDAALCEDCRTDVLDPFSRRYRYPLTTCTNCGPRLTIVERVPYDRAHTSMASFDLCPACAAEYTDPADRRFHAETTACHACGPRARLIRFDGRAFSFDQASMLDDVDAALGLIQRGEIVAIKALGGYQLACDATKAEAVEALRARKQRDSKPFALMARDIDIIRRYCEVSEAEEALLRSPAAPIVLLKAREPRTLPESIAPGLTTLGFMLPSTPMHVLLLRRMGRPVVMTSGNRSREPQIVDDDEACRELHAIAPFALIHDRGIVNRVDDSVVRFADGAPRFLRRARGYAPAPIALPEGFRAAPQILALGGDLKSAFCLVKDGAATLSQHIGDLDEARTADDLTRTITLYRDMLEARPELIVADFHPAYRSRALAAKLAERERLPLISLQHHHAHIAACLAENGVGLAEKPVLGIVLDGLGFGADGTIWGGEFLLADYLGFERLGSFKPVAMLGGDQASRQPWRNLYAHLMAEMGWANFTVNFAGLALHERLAEKPRKLLDTMLRDDIQAPKASSCGRLFDAVAAALDLDFEAQGYEGEAASRLEALADDQTMREGDPALDYPFSIPNLKGSGLPYIEPLAMWNAVLGDLLLDTPRPVMAARFHRGLTRAIIAMTRKLAQAGEGEAPRFDRVALSGGCFNNRLLLEGVAAGLRAHGFEVLSHRRVPAGDGGIALGQAAIAAARSIHLKTSINKETEGAGPCVSAFQAGS